MKLPKGVTIRKNNRTYRGECPDEFVTEKVKSLISEHEKRAEKGKKENKKSEKIKSDIVKSVKDLKEQDKKEEK